MPPPSAILRTLDALEVETVGHAHRDGGAHRPFVLRGRLQRLLEGDALIGERELERLARAAIRGGKHARKAIRRDLLHARDEPRIRPSDRRLLDLELGRNRAARTDDGHIVQALLASEVELLRAHVEPVEMAHPRFSGAPLKLLIGARAIVEQGTRLGKHHERVWAHVRERARGPLVHDGQEAIKLRRYHPRVNEFEKRRDRGVVA